MECPVHTMSDLFAQLGRASDEVTIGLFLESRCPLAGTVQLPEAVFWSPAQAAFLREALLDDADWAEVADELNADLRAGQ